MGILARFTGLFLAVAILSQAGQVHAQQPPDIQTVVASYKQAIIKGDGATVAALFADDVVVSDLGTTASGKAAALEELRQAFAQNPNFSIAFSDTSYVLNTAIQRFAFASDPIRAAGFNRIWAIETLVVQNGKIASYTAVFDSSDAETVRFLKAVSGQ